MCYKVVDPYVPILKFVPDWFVTSKMIRNPDDDTIFVNEDSNYVTIFIEEMVIFSVDLNNINLDHVNFDKDDPKTFIHVRLMTWCN